MPVRPLVAIALTAALAGAPAGTATVAAGHAPDAAMQARVDAAVGAAATLPRLRSVLASREGELLVERYFSGARATTPANIKSASKSVLSALVGAALVEGHLRDVAQPIAPYFAAELGPGADPRTRALTVEHLLSMKTGLQSTSGPNYGAWVSSANWVRYVLRRPMVAEPGTTIEYSTGTSHVLSALLTKVTGQSTWAFAQRALARPLGFSLARWPRDPQGIYFGGNDMLMTPRQMLAFGELYLKDGVASGRRLVPEGWVARTCTPRGRSRWGSDREYGYSWWIRDLAGHTACYAWGYGGQFIFVVPSVRLVVVTTSDPNVTRERREHLEGLYGLAARIVEAVAAPASGEADQ